MAALRRNLLRLFVVGLAAGSLFLHFRNLRDVTASDRARTGRSFSRSLPNSWGVCGFASDVTQLPSVEVIP